MTDRDHLRHAYMQFRAGAGLREADVKRLLATRGVVLSNNALRELGRDSDRGASCSSELLDTLISAWADERIAARNGEA